MKRLTWNDVEHITHELGNAIQESGYEPDYIIGVTSGGLIPLYFLIKQLDIENILTITAKSYDKDDRKELKVIYLPHVDLKNKKILLVDEITDSGTTLKAIADLLKTNYQVLELKTATLAVNTDHCKYHPDFSVLKESGEWLVFPWEKEEFPEYFK